MSTAALRQQLHQYIEQANDKKIQGLFMLVEGELQQIESFELTKEERQILDEERRKHLNGETESYTWEEAKKIIRNK